jgi:YD repeat-containing protein
LAGTCAVANRILDLGYTFDANANVGAITDYTAAAKQTRGMTYDALDRLTQTTSVPFGTATYTYDQLDNLTRMKVGASAQVAARDQFYCYNATTQRLDFVRSTNCSGAALIALDYDVQGNLKNKNSRLHTFDFGNRLRTIAGGTPNISTSYLYDGLGRRVSDSVGAYSRENKGVRVDSPSDSRNFSASRGDLFEYRIIAVASANIRPANQAVLARVAGRRRCPIPDPARRRRRHGGRPGARAAGARCCRVRRC